MSRYGYAKARWALPVGFAVVALLAGCTSPAPAPSETSSAPPPPASAPPTSTPLALDPEGDAAANLVFFVASAKSLLDGAPDSGGREIVDHLVAAGFDKAQMEVTPDTTAVGLKVDNIQFSVRMNGDCLVGQSGNVGFHAIVAPLLSTGTCLVGKTRAIDW